MHKAPLTHVLTGLSFSRWSYQLTFDQPALLPAQTGSMLRGALGHALKLLYCSCADNLTSKLLHKVDCLYSSIFENTSKAELISNGITQVPPAFVFSPLTQTTRGNKKTTYQGQITLLGVAHQHATEFFQALRLAAYRGLGVQQQSAALSSVEQLAVSLLNAQDVLSMSQGVEIKLISPLFIKRRMQGTNHSKAVQAHQFNFQAWLVALHRRLSILHSVYQVPASTLPALANWLDHSEHYCVTHQLYDERFARHSNRQQQSMPLSGLLGTIQIHQPLPTELLSAMHLGQWLHIGGKTAFGLGAYQLQPIH